MKRDCVSELSSGEVTATNILTKLLRLQQCADGFLKPDGGDYYSQVSRAKLGLLEDTLEDIFEAGEKVVIFCRFTEELESVDRQSDLLLLGDYESYLQKMKAFINGESKHYSSSDARQLMQKYLEYRFYCVVKNENLCGKKFEDFINALHENNLITDKHLIKRLHCKREEYNVDVHTFDNDSEDAKRNSIIELEKLLFSI